ncbi:MAG: hypothetical protein DMF79_19535 [Acidobacteria bacterium]|nr:MAG: hypothetical protein DMF79_19535 [Acidobacteriota bacterium]
MTLDRDALADWALGVALPVVPWVITAWVAARVTGFGADSAISFAQAARYLDLGEFPTRGLMNSHEFWNPNGLVLFTSALIALSRNPLVFTVLLSTVQALAVLACYRSLTANGPRRWLTYLLGLPLDSDPHPYRGRALGAVCRAHVPMRALDPRALDRLALLVPA